MADANRDDSLDNAAWLKKLAKRQKKREQELAARKAREMEEADKAAYDENDLTGLKVGHGTEDFETGEDVILTLQDQGVLADEGEATIQCLRALLTDRGHAAKRQHGRQGKRPSGEGTEAKGLGAVHGVR